MIDNRTAAKKGSSVKGVLSICVASLLVLMHFGGTRAIAAPDAQAFDLFQQGDFEAAAERAIASGGAEDFALAARALNAKAYLEEDDRLARRIAKRAFNAAEEAAKLQPSLVESHLQGAIALAQRGGRMSRMRAFLGGYASRARDRLDLALALEPENAWALSSSAAWHLEISRRGGEGRLGSDPETGYAQFMAAHAADPGNLLIGYECALRLIASGREEWRNDALAALKDVIAGEPKHAFERALQTRGRALQQAVDAGPEAERAFIDAHP